MTHRPSLTYAQLIKTQDGRLIACDCKRYDHQYILELGEPVGVVEVINWDEVVRRAGH